MRIRINITGLVQGVGFRPFIHRLASELGLKGYVLNNPEGVQIEAEGDKPSLDEFLIRIERDKPDISKIFSLQHAYLDKTGYEGFEIRSSMEKGERKTSILPDIALCSECTGEITNPKDRRFLYLFTNCTNCGPRFTITNSLPYDRKNTSMKEFPMCPDCTKEYHMPTDRRFHAQPNACPVCGPWISLFDSKGNIVCTKEEALEKTIGLIRKGSILAIKGLGGYHLICDASNNETILRLRERKYREEKPMAVMFPDVESIKSETVIGHLEERAISSIERPIVIVKKGLQFSLAPSISPENSTIGVFLPYTPLHYVILRKFKKPVVATSANMTDEPIVKDNDDAFQRLAKIADYVLAHNRKIVRRCDDSVVRVLSERQVPVRRSRGYAPLPITLPYKLGKKVLALGPFMNNTIACGMDNTVYISQHIGDLDTPLAMEFYVQTVEDFLRLFDIEPDIVVSDLHPGYYSTKFGENHFKSRLIKVQHHFAHILSCMAENEMALDERVIGFSFDGTGYGPDKTIWGGEVLIATYKGFQRAFHLAPYRLPGGDKAVKEPCRTALSLLYETFGSNLQNIPVDPLSENEKSFYLEMISKDVNSPLTSSMGRLFDGIASLIGLSHKISYHAQAAIALEQEALKSDDTGSYPFTVEKGIIYQFPVIEKIVDDLNREVPGEVIAKRFHNTIAEMMVATAEMMRKETGISRAALSGGVFQNSLLTETAFNKLSDRGFSVYLHQLLPPNDGGISLGQAVSGQFL
jgi:hydrogenase maturation protein HypF